MSRVGRVGLILGLAATLPAVAGASAQSAKPVLRVVITGQGVVTSGDGRISCPRRCSAAYRRGTVRDLTAEETPYFFFVGWTGGCTGEAFTCLLAVDRSKSVHAVFRRYTGTLLLSVTGPGAIEVEPGGAIVRGQGSAVIPAGRTITLIPRPDAGAGLKGWEDACAGASLDSCSFTKDAGPQYVAAAFGQTTPGEGLRALTVERPLGVATVTSTPPGIDCPEVCSASFPAGTLVALQASVPAHYWTQWGGACGGYRTCLLVLDTSVSASASAYFNQYYWARTDHVAVTVSGAGVVWDDRGEIRCGGGSRYCGTGFDPREPWTLRLSAIPGRHARFGGWGGACYEKRPRCTVSGGSSEVFAFFRRSSR